MAGSLAELVENSDCLAIIGMEKNAGKTTVLNHILETSSKGINGITSIGYDGEETDQVTATSKPRIYVGRGTLVATAHNLVQQCDFTRELLCFTGFHTPMGEVIIMRALSDGFAQIAGPSTTVQMSRLALMLQTTGASRVIIDGAAARRSTAAITIADSCILATGASFSPDLDHIILHTAHQVALLTLPQISHELKNAFGDSSQNNAYPEPAKNRHENDNSCILLAQSNLLINAGSSLDDATADFLTAKLSDAQAILCRGVVPARLIEKLISRTCTANHLTIVATDGTRFLLAPAQLAELNRRGIRLQVLHPINLLAVTINPYSPAGFTIDGDLLRSRLQAMINLPVFNVLAPEGLRNQ